MSVPPAVPPTVPPSIQRLVLDTNVVVAALLWNGVPQQLLAHAMADPRVRLFSSPVLLAELAHTLGYAKLAPRIAAHRTSAEQLVARYTALVSLVIPASTPARGGAGCGRRPCDCRRRGRPCPPDRQRRSQAPVAHRDASGHCHRHRAPGAGTAQRGGVEPEATDEPRTPRAAAAALGVSRNATGQPGISNTPSKSLNTPLSLQRVLKCSGKSVSKLS